MQTAFRRLHWPASRLILQPPNGKTLVNFDTNARTANDHPSVRTVTLLGQRVTVEATPVRYSWHWGDGTSTDTDEPGRAYPHLDVTHRYLRTGTVHPSVATTYTGRYRLGRGAWQQIPGSLTIPGTPLTLRVIEATPVLVQSP